MTLVTYNKLRIGRTSIPGQTYLITMVTEQRKRIFADVFLGRIVVNTMRIHDIENATRTWAFVVMPDHVHWLFELRTNSLSQLLMLVKGRSSRLLNVQLGLNQRIWQPSFHDHAVRTEQSLIDMTRYVVMNPVRAGLVGSIGNYSLWDSVWLL
jgi:putative transposase